MSSTKLTDQEIFAFIGRFREVCDSSQPAEIARSLNISYQAAKNYLNGRLPDPTVLLAIAEKTRYSVHWLLTGEGEKFVETSPAEDTLLLSDRFRESVREICRELINEILSSQTAPAQEESVVLTSGQIMEEKVLEKPVTFSEKQQ